MTPLMGACPSILVDYCPSLLQSIPGVETVAFVRDDQLERPRPLLESRGMALDDQVMS